MSKVYTIEEIKNQLQPVFESYPIYRAFLFGSYAKGNANELSDVDIVIDSRNELLNINFYGVLEEATETLEKNIDLFEISELQNSEEFLKEGVMLYDR